MMMAIVGVLFAAWVALNVAAFAHNRRLFPRRADFTPDGPLLVVVAHQDDELICAGGAMLRTAAKGGKVHVVYLTDGAVPDSAVSVEMREREALNCLAEFGAAAHFLRYENERGLQAAENVAGAIGKVADLMREINPHTVVTSAFEGGHSDHDMTNCIVARAAAIAGIPRARVFEAPEYNRYYLREYLLRKLNHVVLIRFDWPPRFLPGGEPGFTLDLSQAECMRKRALFRHFESQSPERLVKRFGFPDQFRVLPAHDYAKGPFDPKKSLRCRLGFWMRKDVRAPFYGGMTLDDYRRVYDSISESLSAEENAMSPLHPSPRVVSPMK